MTVRILRRFLFCSTLLALMAGMVPGEAHSETCRQLLGPGAQPVGAPYLCSFRDGCNHETFACQRFRDTETDYLVAYKGGRVPDAIYWAGDQSGYPPVPLWRRDQSDATVVCDLPVPNELTGYALHLGTGVCLDEFDASVPCSLYEAVAPRQSSILRHFIFYEPADDFFGARSDRRHVETHRAGINEDAFVAELAWLIGSGLADSECCRQRGEAYLNYAHQLFPEFKPYSGASPDRGTGATLQQGRNP